MNDTTTTGDELVVEPPGPLPEFEGRIPIAVQTALQGAYGLDDESNDPVVVVLYGGRRTLWPDDYPVGMARPVLGAMVAEPDTDEDAQVVELLDHVTGESLGVWSEADEEARLLAEEQRLAVVELLDHVTGESLGVWSEADEEARLLAEEQRLAVVEDVEAGQVLTDGQRVNRQPWPGFDDMSAKDVISKLTTEVTEIDVAANVYLYEEAHKARAGVMRTARARTEVLQRQAVEAEQARALAAMDAAFTADLPPLPDDEEVGR